MKKIIRSAFAWVILLCVVPQAPRAQYTPPDADGTSAIAGTVLDANGKKISGVRVHAYHLSSARLFASTPTGGNGKYRIEDVPYGYYDLAVETPDGLYVASRVVNVAPASTSAAILTLVPYGAAAPGPARKHPVSDEDPLGLATMRQKARGRDFWRSPKGVAILAGTAAAGLLAIASGSDSESVSSVF
jgi:hypothetical protein